MNKQINHAPLPIHTVCIYIYIYIYILYVCIYIYIYTYTYTTYTYTYPYIYIYPVDTGRKLNKHKRSSERSSLLMISRIFLQYLSFQLFLISKNKCYCSLLWFGSKKPKMALCIVQFGIMDSCLQMVQSCFQGF